ncbi:caspase family protein [Dokdonella sp.]|uniref:caspase family protein n=1 Tax=Dokdonella sp. TaxID=2291710 RepID=UPI003527F54D
MTVPVLWQSLLDLTPQPAPPIQPDEALQPIRNIAADLRDAGLLGALQAMSPPTIFLSGPHDVSSGNTVTDDTSFSQSIAVVIGINRYQADVPSLRSAVNDASRIADTLQKQHGYRTILLLDEQAIAWRALNEQPALRDQILARYAELQSGRGHYLLDALQPMAEALGPIDEGEPADVAQAAGFWIRRILDGTAPLFDSALHHALDCYDPDFAASLYAEQAQAP